MIIFASPLATPFMRPYLRDHVYSSDSFLARNLTPDYEIVYIRDTQIGRVPLTGTRNGKLEAVITLNGIKHVWIYRIDMHAP